MPTVAIADAVGGSHEVFVDYGVAAIRVAEQLVLEHESFVGELLESRS